MLPQKILNFRPSEVVSGARAAALERMRFAILYAYIRVRMLAHAY